MILGADSAGTVGADSAGVGADSAGVTVVFCGGADSAGVNGVKGAMALALFARQAALFFKCINVSLHGSFAHAAPLAYQRN